MSAEHIGENERVSIACYLNDRNLTDIYVPRPSYPDESPFAATCHMVTHPTRTPELSHGTVF